jgi:hypothetical protein
MIIPGNDKSFLRNIIEVRKRSQITTHKTYYNVIHAFMGFYRIRKRDNWITFPIIGLYIKPSGWKHIWQNKGITH